jgi:hypothetical protein
MGRWGIAESWLQGGQRGHRHLLGLVGAACGRQGVGQERPRFTLRTYTHLLPTSEQRTRQAVDRALTGTDATADGLTTAYDGD